MKKYISIIFILFIVLCLSSCSLFDKVNENDSLIDNTIYIDFGRYPQTVVSDENLIKELDKIRQTNEYGYIEYNGEEYKKQVADPDHYTYTFKNGTKILEGKTYYFKVEPIKWRVLETSNGGYKLLTEYILDNQKFYTSLKNRTINGFIIYTNNYEYSNIRAWLNGYDGTRYYVEDYTNKGFIDIAFTEEEQAIIKTTLVDNSLESTGDKENQYVCNNTNDKIYLLSYQEATNTSYGFDSDESDEDLARRAQATDYALARHCYIDTSKKNYRNGNWLLRSFLLSISDNNNEYVSCVKKEGDINGGMGHIASGVRVAIETNKII